MDCLLCRSYGSFRVFSQASCSWPPEGLFGQSFSVSPPIQALWGFPCLGSFSVVQHIKHIERPTPPRLGSYSTVQCLRCLLGQPLYRSATHAGMWGDRGYSDGSAPMRDSEVLPSFYGYLAFLHRHFPPQSPPSHPLDPSLYSQQHPSPGDCSTIPKLPAAVPSRGPASLSRVCNVVARSV